MPRKPRIQGVKTKSPGFGVSGHDFPPKTFIEDQREWIKEREKEEERRVLEELRNKASPTSVII